MLRSKANADAAPGYFDDGPATRIRGFIRILDFRFLLFGGILAMSACNPPPITIDEYEKLCKAEAYVKVIDPILWERYVKLATENSARIDGKPTLVEVDGFNVLFGKNRERMSPSFPEGIHDRETAVLYNSSEIAILFEKIRTVETFNGLNSLDCYWFSGLNFLLKIGSRNDGSVVWHFQCPVPDPLNHPVQQKYCRTSEGWCP